MKKLSVYMALMAVTICFTLSGCTPTNGTVPVEGTVQYQGQPVPGITSITFQPEGGERPSKGATDDAGHFVINYSINEVGVKPGKYAVTLEWEGNSPDSKITPAIEAVVAKHGKKGTPYEVEITGATTDLVIDVQ